MSYDKIEVTTVEEWELRYAGFGSLRVSIEVNVQSLLGSLQYKMAIRTAVKMPRNHGGDTRRKAPLKVFANQTDGLSTRHVTAPR